MNSASVSRCAIFLSLLLAACQPQTPPTATPAGVTVAPTPTADLGVITPENADRLTQQKQLGMGQALDTPLFSPDGKWLFQATTTGVFAFDTASYTGGRLLAPYSTLPFYDKIMDLSPDGKTLVMGSDLVAVDSGKRLSSPDAKSAHAWAAVFSPDGALLARGYFADPAGAKPQVGVWRAVDGSLLQTMDVGTRGELAFSTDGQLLSIQSELLDEPSFEIFNVQRGEHITSWTGQRTFFLPGNRLAIESDGVVRIYDLETGVSKQAFYGKFAATSPDGKLLALLNFGQFKVYNIADEQLLGTVDAGSAAVDKAILRFSPDGKTLAVYTARYVGGGHTDALALWRVAGGSLIKKMDQPSDLFSFSPDGKSLAVTNPLGATQIIATADGSLSATAGAYHSKVTSVAFLPGGRQLVVAAAGDNQLHTSFFPGDYQPPLLFYQVDSGDLYKTQPAAEHNATLAFSTDGKLYVPDDLRDLPSIKDSGNITSVAFFPDRKKLAIGYYNNRDNSLSVWDLSQKTLLLHASNLPGVVCSLDFSPDGQRLALAFFTHLDATSRSYVRVWDATADGGFIKDLYTDREVSKVKYSPDGRLIAAGGLDGVFVLDASNGTLLFSVDESVLGYDMTETVDAQPLSFSPDGRLLAIGLKNGTLELWDTRAGKKVFSVKAIEGSHNSIYDVDFSPDGSLLSAGYDDGAVRIYAIK